MDHVFINVSYLIYDIKRLVKSNTSEFNFQQPPVLFKNAEKWKKFLHPRDDSQVLVQIFFYFVKSWSVGGQIVRNSAKPESSVCVELSPKSKNICIRWILVLFQVIKQAFLTVKSNSLFIFY